MLLFTGCVENLQKRGDLGKGKFGMQNVKQANRTIKEMYCEFFKFKK